MISFILSNIGTIAVALVLAIIVTLIVWKMLSDKKKGKNSCGCNCKNCPSAGMCHNK